MKTVLISIVILTCVFSLTACINIYNPTTTTTPAAPTSTTTAPPTTSPPTTTTPPHTLIPTITPTIPVIPLVQFEDRTWVLEKYGKAGSLQNAIPGKEVTLKFDSATGKAGGTDGCNSYSANYNRVINKLTVSGITSTMMSCPIPPGIMQQAFDFKDALDDAENCRIVGGNLEINCTLNRLLILHPK